MTKTTSMYILLSITAYIDYVVKIINVNNTYLNDIIDTKIYITQLEGFIDLKYLKLVYSEEKNL